ncbi:MAG TPA: hemerythrin domain-containing protein [Polyangia bacterium]|nr:hemerythrin domain-containing protein [Polyangia bacterium]
MNAIDLLKSQHREVAALFAEIERARTADKKETLFTQLADSLAVHSSIEEHHFYPSVRQRSTEALVVDAMKEHLGIKRTLSELLDIDADEETFAPKLATLKAEVEQHVAEEEGVLFPRVESLLDRDELESLAEAMSAEQAELEREGNPREAVPAEVEASELL